MTTKTHPQNFGNYPVDFDKREARLIACGYSLLQVAATETYTMTNQDSFTHVNIDGSSGTTTLLLPSVSASLGRVIKIYVTSSVGTVVIKDSTGTTLYADAAVGSYELLSNGTSWVTVAGTRAYQTAQTATVAATETLTMTATDGINYVSIGAASGTATILLPPVATSNNRAVNIYVTDSTGTVAIKLSDGSTLVADAAAGSYTYVCNGTTWVRFF